MLLTIGNVGETNLKLITDHLNSHKQRLTRDASNYAKNRQRYWLQHEWDLKNKKFTPAIKDNRLWQYCKHWMPDADLGLVVYGPVGITPHRDDSYADWKAVGINLGTLESWSYDCQYPEFRYTRNQNPSNPQNYEIKPGTVFEFNCKNLHAAVNPASDRWAVFLWKISDKYRNKFNREISYD